MHKNKTRKTIYILALCLSSWLVSLETQAAPAIKQEKNGQLQEPIEHPAAWSDAIPYYNLANKYLEKERYEDAVDNYHEAISRFPDDPDFYINLGFCYRKLGDYESAEQAFRKALTLNNKDWMTWSNLANALLKQNKLAETVSTFEKCLKLTMPAGERAAINRDIADINKILAMRQPKSATKSETISKKVPLAKATVRKPVPDNSNPKLERMLKPAQVKPERKPEEKPEHKTESTGWDYVYK